MDLWIYGLAIADWSNIRGELLTPLKNDAEFDSSLVVSWVIQKALVLAPKEYPGAMRPKTHSRRGS